jgi:5-dehydro-4-deoxyglucarate dehydratase
MTVPLAGLWGFALTPFRDGAVDRTRFTAGVDRMVAGGVDVVCAAGTLGQGDRMSARERLECVTLAATAAAGRVPVIGTMLADDDGRVAADVLAAGASALLLLPTSADPAVAGAALREIRRRTDGQLPVVLYQRGPLALEPAELARLVEEPNLVGLKDAHGDMRRFRRLHEAFGERLTWIGASEDLVLAFWAYGADAFSPASAAYAPAYARRVWGALGRGDRDEALRLLRLFAWPVTDLRLSRPNIDISVVREFAITFGLPVGDLRPPAEPLTDTEQDAVRQFAGVLRAELESEHASRPVHAAAS